MKKVIVTLYINTKFHTVNGRQDVIHYTIDNPEEMAALVKNASDTGLFDRIEFDFLNEEEG